VVEGTARKGTRDEARREADGGRGSASAQVAEKGGEWEGGCPWKRELLEAGLGHLS